MTDKIMKLYDKHIDKLQKKHVAYMGATIGTVIGIPIIYDQVANRTKYFAPATIKHILLSSSY